MKLFDVFPVFDINIVKGENCYVYDDKGIKYLDLYGGHAVISVGHTHPYYVQKVTEQLNSLGFYSNSIVNKLQSELADKLAEQCGYPDYNLFLVNSGAEANENAIKLASFYNQRKKVLSFAKAFHGRTSVTVLATDNISYRAPVNISDNVVFAPWEDLDFVKQQLETREFACVIIEGIQGVAGIKVPSTEFLKSLRQLCTDTDTVLILDEIQSGYGRTGKFFAHQYTDVKADLITVAKGIGNGFPMSAVLINPMFKAVHGQLGTTFGGNHLACAAAIAVLDIMKAEKLVDNAAKIGAYLIEELKKITQIKEVRGCGLMIGMEFDMPVKDIRNNLLFKRKIFTGATGTHVIRLLPPLTLTKVQADHFLSQLKQELACN